LKSERIEFQNNQGETLSGVLEHGAGPVLAWAIFAHCFTCSKKSLAASRISRALAAKGIGTLRFDFTGLGESDGDFSGTGFSSNVADLKSAINWMATHDHQVTLLIGHSLGGAAVIVAGSQLPGIKAVATLGAPSDAGHVIEQFKTAIPEIEARGEASVDLAGRPFVLRKSFLEDVSGANVRQAAAQLKKPLLILHSPIDDVVGIENATGLFLAAKHPKSFISLDHANHLLTSQQDAQHASDIITAWALRYLDPIDLSEQSLPQTHEVVVRETGVESPYQNEISIGGRRFLADEPESVGGADTGPDPYAWVTGGLGACTAMTLRMYADRKKWPLERVTVSLDHDKQHPADCVDCGPKDKIDVFSRLIVLEGDLDEEQRNRLLEIADRCPVHRTLESPVKVETVLATKPA